MRVIKFNKSFSVLMTLYNNNMYILMNSIGIVGNLESYWIYIKIFYYHLYYLVLLYYCISLLVLKITYLHILIIIINYNYTFRQIIAICI